MRSYQPFINKSTLVMATFLLSAVLSTNVLAQSNGRAARADQFTKDAETKINEILASVQDDKSLSAAYSSLESVSDYISSHAGAKQLGAVANAQGMLGIIRSVNIASNDDPLVHPGDTIRLFTQHPEFAIEYGLLISEKDDQLEAIKVATGLMSNRSDMVNKYPALAAAVCVVHDVSRGRYTVRINENTPKGISAIEVFDFFSQNANTMFIKPDRLPAIALVFVVDVTESAEQLQWAHDTYRTSPGIGQRFFEIVYDTEHFRQGKPKRVTEAGDYSLTQIKKHGGVCADQAYFAMSVAKACGIPSGYVVARGADVSHAWVGFLEVRGRRASWNFDEGRYEEYQSLRGTMRNPQTLEMDSDGRIGITASAVTAGNDKTRVSMAVGKAVARLSETNLRSYEAQHFDTKGNIRTARTDSIEDRLKILRQALSACSGVPTTWDQVVEMADEGKMNGTQLDVWARAVMKLAGRTHQDFSFDFLANLITAVDDPQEQHQMWEWAFGQFRMRPDLAAAVRFQQGELWNANNNPEYAWIAYQDVLDNFLNDGPMMNDALKAMGSMLSKNGKRDAYLQLLHNTARKVNRPEDMGSIFAKQSNYYKVHWRLVKELEYHNRNDEAKIIRDNIHMPSDE
jgi:hypothetical protein